jgi:hypothetical protein
MTLFTRRVCDRIRQNLIFEKELFRDGMALYEFIERVFHHHPNCFHSDWLVGHFIEYYFLSELIRTPVSAEEEDPTTTVTTNTSSRLNPLLQHNETMQYFYNKAPPVGLLCEYTSVKLQTNKTCNKDLMICHYVYPERMRQG